MAKDWTGNKRSTFSILGASNHSSHEREVNDYYATDPKAVLPLLDYLPSDTNEIWECACGEGHLSKILSEWGYKVRSTDLIDRGYGEAGVDFLQTTKKDYREGSVILTNPPYKYAENFVEHALKISNEGSYICMFLKLTFLEGQKRRVLFDKAPPYKVLVFSARQKCAINADFDNTGSSAAAYAWFVWVNGFKGKPTIEWI